MSSTIRRWKRPLIRSKILSGLSKYPAYISDLFKYSLMPGTEQIKFRDTYPCLHDKTSKTSVDSHYFYQSIWAFKKIYEAKPAVHIDVASDGNFVGLLTAITRVQFVDIRPLEVSSLENFENGAGDILHLPYKDNSLESISCLHVA